MEKRKAVKVTQNKSYTRLNFPVVWEVTPCSLAGAHRCFIKSTATNISKKKKIVLSYVTRHKYIRGNEGTAPPTSDVTRQAPLSIRY